MDACWYGDLLHRDVFGTVVEKLGESSIRSTMRRKPWKGVNVFLNPIHDIEERQSCTLQERFPIPFEIVFNSDSELVFSLRSKRRFGEAHLEARVG